MWQFENDKIWASYNKKNVIKESKESILYDEELSDDERKEYMDEIYQYHKDGDSNSYISNQYNISEDEVQEIIDRYNTEDPDENGDNISVPEDERGDQIHANRANKQWNELVGRWLYDDAAGGNVTEVPQQKSRKKMIGSNL
jgi:hypothetical protein